MIDINVRYGVYVPNEGYISSQMWEGPKFSEAGKSLSYIDKDDAMRLWDEVVLKYANAMISTLTISVSVAVDNGVPAKERYTAKVAEYYELKARYDAMSHKELDKLPQAVWKYFTTLRNTLRHFDLI